MRGGGIGRTAFGALVLVSSGCGGDARVAETSFGRQREPLPLVQPCVDAPAVAKVPEAPCLSDGWCWETPGPGGLEFSAIARVGNEIWATTAEALWRHDGHEWSLAGAGGDFLLGSDTGAVAAATSYGHLATWDGSAWRDWFLESGITALAGDPGGDFRVLYAHSGSRLASAVWQLVGDEWVVATEPGTPARLLGVVSATDMWADGPGYVQHFDGERWTHVTPLHLLASKSPTTLWHTNVIHVVHATNAPGGPHVWFSVQEESASPEPADGAPSFPRGGLARVVGSRYETMTGIDDLAAVTSIEGTEPWDLWFGTARGDYVHWNGVGFERALSPRTPRPVKAMARAADGRLFAIASSAQGDFFMQHERGEWRSAEPPGAPYDATRTWGAAWNDVWAVGEGGLRMHFDGAGWEVSTFARAEVTGVWGSAGDDVWTVSVNGDIDHFDGRKWETVHESEHAFSDVWGLRDELWMAVRGDPGTVAARYARGELEVFSGDGRGVAIWASSSEDVWLAVELPIPGRGFLRFDGERWSSFDGLVSLPVQDVWGRGPNDVYAVARDGLFGTSTMIHFDGERWSTFGDPGAFDVLSGCGEERLFAAGSDGVGTYDGTEWSVTTVPGGQLSGVWGTSADFGIAVGRNGHLLRRSR